MMRREYNPGETRMILKNNRRIGYYQVKIRPNHYFINNIQISGPFQGKGIGSYILGLIEKQAGKAKKTKIRLEVFKDNPAKRLYQRTGYKTVITKRQTVIMEKNL